MRSLLAALIFLFSFLTSAAQVEVEEVASPNAVAVPSGKQYLLLSANDSTFVFTASNTDVNTSSTAKLSKRTAVPKLSGAAVFSYKPFVKGVLYYVFNEDTVKQAVLKLPKKYQLNWFENNNELEMWAQQSGTTLNWAIIEKERKQLKPNKQ